MSLRRLTSALVLAAAATPPAFAQTSGTWITDASATYNTPANWDTNTVPNGGGTATFGGAITANRTITVNASPTLAAINFTNVNSSGAYTLSAAGTINMTAGATINLSSPAVNTVNSILSLAGPLTFTGTTFGNQNFAGAIQDGTGTGSVVVNTTPAHVDAGSVFFNTTNTFSGGVTLQSGMLRIINAGAIGTGTLNAAGGILQAGGTFTLPNAVNVNAANLVSSSTGSDLTYGGVISGTNGVVGFQRAGSSILLTNANTYNGITATRLIPVDTSLSPSNAGFIILRFGGTALNSSQFEASGGGRIILDNGGAAFGISRMGVVPVQLNNGIFQVTGGTDTAAGSSFTQNAGQLVGTGYSVVSSGAIGTHGVEIAFTGISRGTNGNGTFLFTATSALGGAAAGLGVQRVTFATPPALVGGALNTTSAGVIPFAVGGQGFATPGTGLVTYDANGVRLLDLANEYSVDAIAAGTNVRLTAPAVNATPVVINSLFINGAATLTGAGAITVTSGTVAATNSPTIATPLAFGATQANFFTFVGNITVTGVISGTGGLVKSGGSTNSASNGTVALVLSPYNTYTGTTTVNDGFIQFTDQTALGTSTSAIQLYSRAGSSGSGLRVDANADGLVVNLTRPVVTNNGYSNLTGATGQGNARSVLIASGNVSGPGGVMVSGTNNLLFRGVTFLAGTNTNQGSTRLFAGDVAFASDANLGAAGASFDFGPAVGCGVVLFGDWSTARVVNVSGTSQLDTNGFNAKVSGVLTGTPTNFVKAGLGTLTFTGQGAINFSPGTFNVAGGGVTVAGTTRLTSLSGSSLTLLSGVVRSDNTTTPLDNRLGAQAAVRFGNAGYGTFQIDAGSNVVNQTLSSIVSGPGGTGGGRFAMTASGAGGVRVNVTSTTGYGVTGNNSPSLIVQGDGLVNTSTATLPGQTAVLFATTPSEANGQAAGTGAAGTNTVRILRGGYGVRTGTGAAVGLLTQTSATVGARLLDEGTEYAVNSQVASANTLITAATAAFTAGTVNSVYVRGGNTLSVTSGATLTVNSGTFLSTGGANVINGTGPNGGGAVLASPAINAIQSGFIFNVDTGSTLTVNATYSGSAAGARIVKVGTGRLVFDPRDATGAATSFGTTVTDTRVFEGTFAIPAANSFANIAGNLFLAGGAATVFEYRGASVQTGKTINLNGAGGTLDLAGSAIQLTGATSSVSVTTAGNVGELRMASGTLILGGGTSAAPTAVQPNTFEGGLFLNGGTVVLNADSYFALPPASALGSGTLRLNGGQLAPKFAARAVSVPVEVNANTTFVNNTTDFEADTSNSGLNFLAPLRLEGNYTLTNNMTGGALTLIGSVYDNPYKPAATLTLTATPTAGQIVLAGAAVHRGGTVVTANTVVQAANPFGSATGTGNVTVNAGGELRGGNAAGTAGFIVPAAGGTVTVNGTLAPGNGIAAPGILTVGAPDRGVTLTVNGAASRYTFNLAATNAGSATPLNDGSSTTAVGTGNNFLSVVSDGSATLTFTPVTFAVASTAGLSNWDPMLYYSWQVATVPGGTASINAPAFDTTEFGNAVIGSFALSRVGQVVYLNYSPVPEPGCVLAACAAAAGVWGGVRRWRKAAAVR